MALPRDQEARDYYRSGLQWLDDAKYLLKSERPRASVYLGGYTVECMFKALIISSVPRKKQAQLIRERTLFTHDLGDLKALYQSVGGFPLPRSIVKDLSIIGTWGPERRYLPGAVPLEEADQFVKSVERIAAWADGRL